jgi:hypothetical protein
VSTTNSTEEKGDVVYSKPRANVYTLLLVLSLLALIIGCIFLYMYMGTYEWKIKGGPSASLIRSSVTTLAGTDAPTPLSILPL